MITVADKMGGFRLNLENGGNGVARKGGGNLDKNVIVTRLITKQDTNFIGKKLNVHVRSKKDQGQRHSEQGERY